MSSQNRVVFVKRRDAASGFTVKIPIDNNINVMKTSAIRRLAFPKGSSIFFYDENDVEINDPKEMRNEMKIFCSTEIIAVPRVKPKRIFRIGPKSTAKEEAPVLKEVKEEVEENVEISDSTETESEKEEDIGVQEEESVNMSESIDEDVEEEAKAASGSDAGSDLDSDSDLDGNVDVSPEQGSDLSFSSSLEENVNSGDVSTESVSEEETSPMSQTEREEEDNEEPSHPSAQVAEQYPVREEKEQLVNATSKEIQNEQSHSESEPVAEAEQNEAQATERPNAVSPKPGLAGKRNTQVGSTALERRIAERQAKKQAPPSEASSKVGSVVSTGRTSQRSTGRVSVRVSVKSSPPTRPKVEKEAEEPSSEDDSDGEEEIEADRRSEIPRMMVDTFVQKAPEIERALQSMIREEVMESLGTIENQFQEVDHLVQRAVQDSVYVTEGVSWDHDHVIVMRNAIVGPEACGKSTVLKMLARETYDTMLANGQYKRTLMLCLDFNELKDAMKTPIKFMDVLISKLLDELLLQWPLMKQLGERQSKIGMGRERKRSFLVYDLLTEFFSQFREFTGTVKPLSPKFPKNYPFDVISNDILGIGKMIGDAMLELSDMNPFFKMLSCLPRLLARTFGFTSVYYVFDHVDLADVNVNPSAPFSKKCVPILLFEYVKLMIKDGNYSLSCCNEERFLQALEPFDETGCDLRSFIDVISVLDCGLISDSNLQLVLALQGYADQAKLSGEACEGAPAYMAKWNVIVDALDKYTQIEEEGDPVRTEKERLAVLVLIRELAKLILAPEITTSDGLSVFNTPIVDFQIVN